MDHLDWRHLLAKRLATATRDSHLWQCDYFALATLGGTTRNRNNLFLCYITQGGQGKYMVTVTAAGVIV
jgi:hypothetical protein